MSLDKALASLRMTQEELINTCVADLRKHGVLTLEQLKQLPALEGTDGVSVGDLVAIWAHQRYRAARVWKVGRVNVSAVYLTPTHLDEHARYNRPLHPNNITGEAEALLAS